MRSVEVAAAPQIVRPIMDGVAKLCGFVTGNAALATLLVLLGAVVIITCVVLLVLRKWWPSTQIGQALQGEARSDGAARASRSACAASCPPRSSRSPPDWSPCCSRSC
ncbi:hypothetical protein SAMN04489748_1637 [Bifidobacterium longum]|uniref:Uncharacterized protein n=2 Tax=Bifidobacterium longum TaxID=216816 RepID=A0AA45V8X2_BIFLN|nr:hypothetical protein SAMN04489748_1637 [Bifidobacterium longum]